MDEKIKLNIFLIRHGEKSQDLDTLSKNGIKQITLLSKRLRSYNITKVISSDLPRCIESAKIIEKQLKIKINYSSSLREVEGDVKDNPSVHKKEIKILRSFYNELIKEIFFMLLVNYTICQ